MYMSDPLDFNIENYSIDELYQLLELKKNATAKDIERKADGYIQKYTKEGQPNYYNFFLAARNKLLDALDDKDNDEADDGDGGGEFIKTEYAQNPTSTMNLVDRKNYTQVVDSEHAVLRRERLPISQGRGTPFVQGQMNAVLRNRNHLLINIDSHYRQILRCQTTAGLDCSGTTCTTNSFKFSDSSTDFTFDLSHPITNVLRISLYSYEIPHAWYVFDPAYGTTQFQIDAGCIEIPAGNYDASGLMTAIGAVLPGGYTITYNPSNGRVTLTGAAPFALNFYDLSGADCSGAVCGGNGPKLDFNLGWLLGFREAAYSGAASYTGESLLDVYGTRYLFLEVDDFNQNRLNQGIISLTANRDTFSVPASIRCRRPASQDPSNNSSCGKPLPTWRGPGLTAVQTYARAQLINAQQQGFPDRYLSPTGSNILARIPVRKFNHYDLLFDNWNASLKDTAREYFGPVTLKRLRIKLLNDKGYVVNLNRMDFSFSLLVEQLYQY